MSATKNRPFTPTEERIGSVAIKLMSHANTWLFRASSGRFGARWVGGAPIMLLTTTGRKTGKPRTAPLLYLEDGDNVVIVASKGGMSHHPLWFGNLEADPSVEVEIGTRKRRMKARRASDAEKVDLWPRLTAMYKDFDDYQARTERNIPVVILSPS